MKPVTFDDYVAVMYHISALYWHFGVIFGYSYFLNPLLHITGLNDSLGVCVCVCVVGFLPIPSRNSTFTVYLECRHQT